MAALKVLYGGLISIEWPPHRCWMTVPFVLDGDASGRGWGMGCFLVIDDGCRYRLKLFFPLWWLSVLTAVLFADCTGLPRGDVYSGWAWLCG